MGKHLPGRLTTAQRGYGKRHQELRAHWRPFVEAGRVDCTAPVCLVEQDGGTRRIRRYARPDEWDLGHDEKDRRKYSGPQHAPCNRGQSRRSPTKVTKSIDPPAPFDASQWR
jgi:hypothetical protein